MMRTASSPKQPQPLTRSVKGGSRYRSLLILMAITALFLAGSGTSLWVAHQLFVETREDARASFEAQTSLLEEAVVNKFDKPLQALKGLQALHALNRGFDKKWFRDYWAARGFQRDFPGAHGFGYIVHVPPKEIERFVASERRYQSPDYRLKTLGPTSERYIIKLIEPIEDNRSAIGLDIGSERVRRTAADEAMRSGLPTLSGAITLVQDGRQGPGFLLLLPTYLTGVDLDTEANRRASHVGFVYSPLVAEDLFKPLLLLARGLVHFDLEARSPHDLPQWVFQSERYGQEPSTAAVQAEANAPLFTTNRHFLVAGLEFRLQTRSSRAFEATVDTGKAWEVGLGGSMLSAMLAFVLWLFVSGRARAEARAQDLTREMWRLALVAERTSNSVIIADAEHRIVWVNQAFTALSGYTLEEVRGRKTSEFRGDVQDPQTLERIRTALQNGENLRIETVNQSRDGRIFWVDLDLQTLRDADGGYQGYVAVERDITEAKQQHEREAEHAAQLAAALRETEALMRTVNAHAIVSETGPDGRILKVNDAFCRISGYSPQELIGQDHRIINSGVQPPEFWAAMWDTISAGKPWRGQTCNRAKDGSLYWVDSLIAPNMDADGKIEKYTSIRFDITQARHTELALARERQRLKSTLEGTNVGTWEVNVLTGENRIDARWAEMLGYTLDELTPITPDKWKNLIHPGDEKQAQSLLLNYLQGASEIYETERRLRHKSGHWIWVLSRGTVSSRLADGRIEWLAGTHMDVTERHKLYEQIEQRNNLMSAIMDNMPGGLSAFDADLKLVAKNQLFARLLDFPDALFDRPVVRFEDIIRFNAERGEYGPGDVDSIVLPIIERARQPSPHVFERVRPDGRVLEVRGRPMPGGGFVTIYTDITQRKQAEKDARQSDEMLRQAINTLDEAFVIYDDQDRLLICNQRYRDIYPVAAGVMQPGNTFEYIIRYGAERGEYAQAIGHVDEWVAERMRQHRSGDTDVVQELGNGRFLRIVERKTSEGYTVGFRIDITDLMRARMAAEAASKSKSQFLANMSHEIRTPMNAILGMLNLLHNTDLSARQLDYVNKTEGAAKSLLELLNDILDFSKVEAGKMTLESAPFRIDQLLRDLSVILSSNTGSKDVEVLFDLDARLPDLLIGDSLRLRQILINLAGNAIKFTEKGMVLIRIEVVDVQPGQIGLVFSVRDTGIGIAPENVRRIFEGFSQAEASTTRRFGGTGLGLAISSRLVHMMGGQLDLDSELGRGSCFHSRIVLGVAGDAAPMIQQPALADTQRLHILIADDNPVARQALQAMVQAMGWQADLAESGEQAINLIRQRIDQRQRAYDAVFVDWQMSGKDGWETSLQIRKLLGGPQPPIVVMATAHGREMLSGRPADELARLNGFLIKPATPSMLLDAIMEAHQGRDQRTTATVSTRRLQGMRVLVVEDNKINQQVAQELLEREGAQVSLADNGQLGVQAIATAQPPFDVVLMDVQMPVMDGYTATRKVRQELGLADLPIIAMTANAMESDREDAMAAGMDAHVGKPFDLDALVGSMLRHSGYVAAQAPPAATPASSEVALPAVPGQPIGTPELDISAALERLGGDTRILGRILQIFARDLRSQPRELAAMLAGGQANESLRLLHTLKGTAATVGAMRLSAVAAEAEHRMKQGSAPLGDEAQEMLARIQSAVDAVSADLAPVLRQLQADAPDTGAVAPAPDLAVLRADLQELLALLRTSDLASLDTYARLRDQHAAALQQQLDTLDEAMAGLDFAQAASLCEALQQRYTA